MSTRLPDAYEASVLDETTGREGSFAHVRAVSGHTYAGLLLSRVLTGARTLDAVVLDTDDGHTTIRWAAVESLLTVPDTEEPTS